MSDVLSTIKTLSILPMLSVASCIHTVPEPATNAYWLTSDASQYTPIARFRARIDVKRDHLVVIVDSATLAIPGVSTPTAPPLMSELYLSAIVAAPDSTSLVAVSAGQGTTVHPVPDRRGWSAVASSDSVPLMHELKYGETAVVQAIAPLIIPGSYAHDLRTLWLIFRINGNTVQLSMPLTEGGDVRRRDLPGGVRVYVCGDRDLLGRLDPSRARALKQAYGIAC